MGRVNTDVDESVALTYRSIEWNPKLNNEQGGYESTKIMGHPWMLSFNGWYTFMPCESMVTPSRMGKLHQRKGSKMGQGSLLGGINRPDELDGNKYVRNESGDAVGGITGNYYISNGALYINNKYQNSYFLNVGYFTLFF